MYNAYIMSYRTTHRCEYLTSASYTYNAPHASYDVNVLNISLYFKSVNINMLTHLLPHSTFPDMYRGKGSTKQQNK